jgi:phosphate/sulfate permease
MPDETPTPIAPIQRPALREWISASIAVVVVLGSIIMIALTYSHIGDEQTFARAKDLLLFINPILGVVIGYYFNKATSEGRAEQAEQTAQTAQTQARRADAETAKARAALGVVHATAEELARQGDTRVQAQLLEVMKTLNVP